MKVTFSAKAEEDLAKIFQYINDDLHNPIAAQNIVEKIIRLSQKLSIFPELGASLKTIDPTLDNYHHLIVDNYLIIYKVTDREVAILRIIYARSKLRTLT